MASPLINPLRVNGGTFYTFTSASNDLTNTVGDSDAEVVFSKFVLLDVPDVATPTSNYENYLVWEAIGSNLGGGTSSVPSLDLDENINFAQSLQNYVLNFEQLALEGKNTLAQGYDQSERTTVSERIFWKWLANLNVLRFRDASTAESAVTGRFVELDPTSYYRRVVKYIGDIDIVNKVQKDGQSYSECYIHVPTEHGNTPVILWKAFADANYAPGMIWSNGNVYVEGRDSGSVHPTGLDLRAYYDLDSPGQYVAQSTFGDVTNVAGTASAGSPKPVVFSKMDGAMIDFDPNSYQAIVTDPNVSIISEFNMTDAASNFQFNVCLVYYDTYRKSDPNDRSTNLFGLLVLDDYVNQGSGYSYLKRFDKFKPNKITKLNGNSYGLKLNIKFDTSIDNVGVEVVINEYNTFSMDLFTDTMNRLQESADLFQNMIVEMATMKERMDTVESIYFSIGDLAQISARLSTLETGLNNARASMNSSSTLLDLINKVSDNIQSILDGRTSLSIAFNLDLIKNGDGTIIDRDVPGQVSVVNTVQQYTTIMTCGNVGNNSMLATSFSNGNTLDSETDGNILVLGKFTNYFKQRNTNTDPTTGVESFADNLYINIDDSNQRWKKGQTMKLYFEGPIDANGQNISIWTDSNNVFGNGAYEKLIGTIYASQLSSSPILEIVCTDETAYTFDINILK